MPAAVPVEKLSENYVFLNYRKKLKNTIEIIRRSREGAWIEMMTAAISSAMAYRRSREGAWIEMALTAGYNLFRSVAPVWERGLK